MTSEQYHAGIRDRMQEIVDLVRVNSFMPGYGASPEECVGLAISKYFEWDGQSILKAASEALTDANFSSEASVLGLLIDAEDSQALAQKIFEAY